jgi:hypothetical protein
MATYRIAEVRVEKTAADPHEHITRVRITGDTSSQGISVSVVAADLRDPNGDRYSTTGGGETASVYVRQCPRCTYRDYITTHPDSTTKNNLLSLPRY